MISIKVVNQAEESSFIHRPQIQRSTAMDIFVPGEKISADLTGYMRGHGTHTAQVSASMEHEKVTVGEANEDGSAKTDTNKTSLSELRASVGGRLRRVNKLLTVEPTRFRYVGHVGDCVVGRVVALGQRRWLIDTNSRLLSALLLSAVNLPGGEQRRKSEEDERAMRAWLREGDVVSAEVQTVHHDGALALHTRSMRYGKVGSQKEGGALLTIPPALVRRAKTHFHTLPCGTSLIVGNNGMIWIEPAPCKKPLEDDHSIIVDHSRASENSALVSRESAARVRNCIMALAGAGLPLYASSIVAAVEFSQVRCSSASELLVSSVAKEMADNVAAKLEAGVI